MPSVLDRVHSVRQKYFYLFEFDSAALSNSTSQMHSSFSKARFEIGLLKMRFQGEFPHASAGDSSIFNDLIDSLLSELTKQESHYWFALALVHATYGTAYTA